jgi:hypothetical protein
MRSVFTIAIIFLSTFLIAQSTTSLTLGWANSFGGAGGDDMARNSIADANGNVYVTGRIDGTVDFDPGAGVTGYTETSKAYIAAYDPTGGLIWAGVMTGTGTSAGTGIGLDASGNIYVTGFFSGGDIDFDMSGGGVSVLTPTSTDMFVAKYSPMGNFIFAKRVGEVGGTVDPYFLKVTASGDVYIVGNYNMGGIDFDPGIGVAPITFSAGTDFFLAKYNSLGNYVWANGFGGSGTDYGIGVDVDASGNSVITGQFDYTVDFDPGAGTQTIASTGGSDIYIAKYDNNGNYLWADGIGGSLNECGNRVIFDNQNNVICAGIFASNTIDADPGPGTVSLNLVAMAGNDMFLGKYNGATGQYGWAKNTGASVAPGDVYSFALVSDPAGNIYVAGSFPDVVDFDLSAATATLQAATLLYEDIFIARYDANANYVYAYNMGGGSQSGNVAHGLSVIGNTLILTGELTNTVDMDPGLPTTTITTNGMIDFFVAHYSQCVFPVINGISMASNSVCPGSSATISLITSTLNDATQWTWYSTSCGGPTVGTGNPLVFTPTVSQNIYVRGEGGCVPTMTCGGVFQQTYPATNIMGSITNPTVNPVNGKVILFKYEPNYTKFDTTVKQTLAGGNYTFSNVNAGTYILMAEPTASNLQTTYSGDQEAWKDAVIFTHTCSGATTQNISVISLSTFTGAGSATLTGKIVEGTKYGQKGSQISAPGAPIKGISVKGGRNPGGNIGAQDRTKPDGTYTLTGLTVNGTNESYFILVDIPGLDTNGTYHKVIVTGTEIFSNLDFVIDSAKVNPQVFVGFSEKEVITMKDIKVYPNPTTGKLYIQLTQNDPGKMSINITDIAGKIVREVLPETFESTKDVTILSDQSTLKPGVYFLKIFSNNKESVTKIIINE